MKVPKVPGILESVSRPSIVKVPLEKGEDKSITNKKSKKRKRKVKVRK